MSYEKKIIIIILTVFVLSILGISGFLIYDNKRIVSTLILDINPSIKITLNKKDKVLSAVPLNDDAKKIVSNDLKGKKLDNAIEIITNNVIKQGFVEEEKIVVLVNTTGKIESNNVEKIVKNKFENKDIECDIIIQKTNNESVENAKKYNISESKAAFIEEIIENNNDLNFEDLKDKSIKELEKIKEETKEDTIVKPVEEEKNKVETPVEETPVTPPQSSKPSYSNPPSDPTDTSGVWCT